MCSPVNIDLIAIPEVGVVAILAQGLLLCKLADGIVVAFHLLPDRLRFSCQAKIGCILLFLSLEVLNLSKSDVFLMFYNCNRFFSLQTVARVPLPVVRIYVFLLTGIAVDAVAPVR